MAKKRPQLDGAERTDFGKGAARRLRRDEQIPAVVYGKADPIHVSVPVHDLALLIRNTNALIDLNVGDETYMVLPRDIQRDVVTRNIEHVDLLEVRKGDKRVVDVYIHVEGEPAPGAVSNLDLSSIPIEADVTHIPEFLTIDIEGREIGDHALAGDIELPEGSTLMIPEDQLVVNISEKREIEEEPEVDEDAEGTEEGAEGGEEGADGDGGEEESSDD